MAARNGSRQAHSDVACSPELESSGTGQRPTLAECYFLIVDANGAETCRGAEHCNNQVARQLRQEDAHAASDSQQGHGPRQHALGAHLRDVSGDCGNFPTLLAVRLSTVLALLHADRTAYSIRACPCPKSVQMF